MAENNAVTIVPVEYSDKKLFKRFLDFPYELNADDPCWVPPLKMERRKFFDPRRGPFFENGEVQYFLALRGDKVVGRISAQLNHLHEAKFKDNTGFFGFFECENDKEAAHALFDAAAKWVSDRGRTRILGPLGFSIYEDVGVLVEGYDELPALMQTHNKPYYDELVTTWPMQKAIDWYAFRFINPYYGKKYEEDESTRKRKSLLAVLEKVIAKNNLVLRNPKPNELKIKAEQVLEIFNENWKDNWGHVDITPSQWKYLYGEIKDILRSDFIHVIEDPDGELVAFALTVPDINPALKDSKGRLGPITIAKLLYQARYKPQRVRVMIMGVKREWQGRRLHHALLMKGYLHHEHSTWISQCDMSLVVETNTPLLKALKLFQAERYKTWRLYERDLEEWKS